MQPKQLTYKSPEQFVKGGKNKAPKGLQGKPSKKTKVSKAPKKGKSGSQMLTKAMAKLAKC